MFCVYVLLFKPRMKNLLFGIIYFFIILLGIQDDGKY